jgi:hypothetical protein
MAYFSTFGKSCRNFGLTGKARDGSKGGHGGTAGSGDPARHPADGGDIYGIDPRDQLFHRDLAAENQGLPRQLFGPRGGAFQ